MVYIIDYEIRKHIPCAWVGSIDYWKKVKMIFRKFALWLGIGKFGEWKGSEVEKSLLGVQ